VRNKLPANCDRSILFLCTALQRAGAETQVATLALALKARGWDVSVVSMTTPTAFVEELRAAGVYVESLDMPAGSANPVALLRFRRILRQRRPTVVHSHLIHANLLARLTRMIRRVPLLVSTAHSISDGGLVRRWVYRVTDRMSDLTTNVSQAAVDRYVQVGAVSAERIRFVPNGLVTERFVSDDGVRRRLREELSVGDAFAWLAVGRFEEAKDYPNMLRAFGRVLREHPGALLLIAGRGKLQDETKRLAEELKVGDHVRFLGVRRDVPQLMAAADGYALSSAWEGMPMVLLEASAASLPIVATRVGGNAEVVLDGESGLLAPAKDSEALAACMLRLMGMTAGERKAMGERGRAFVKERYDMPIIVDQWERIYAELLSGKGGRQCA
jgi:glycosyltransferase involved in cell wall biosynthesis